MALVLTVVDAFTDRAFGGNPAAVAVLDRFPSEERMQAIASEMNLSETAFVVPGSDEAYDLRWFTPTSEVNLCGHATLASAHVLGGTAKFSTKSGILRCARTANSWIEMDFPADPPTAARLPQSLEHLDVRWYGTGAGDSLLELAKASLVRGFEPDLALLGGLGTRTVIVTAEGDRPGVDCVSRVFAPNVGISEDPVTGSAHCTLAPYWAPRRHSSVLIGEQASRRGGIVKMALNGDRVLLSGQAVTTARVELLV